MPTMARVLFFWIIAVIAAVCISVSLSLSFIQAALVGVTCAGISQLLAWN